LLLQSVDGINELEVGYHLFKNYRGKGYASEIAQFLKQYAFTHNLCDSIVSIIHIDNMKSQKVAERNGMKREKTTMFFDNEHIVYRIFK
jgi:RimJ/RimL family protein N-acetyltransferase